MTNASAPTHRRVARATRAGGPEVLDIAVEDLRPLKTGEALVRVEAAGLNHVDSLARSGTYSIRFEFPFDVGVEGAGTVVAGGAGVAIPPGTRVCWTAVVVRPTSSRRCRCWRTCRRSSASKREPRLRTRE